MIKAVEEIAVKNSENEGHRRIAAKAAGEMIMMAPEEAENRTDSEVMTLIIARQGLRNISLQELLSIISIDSDPIVDVQAEEKRKY